MNQPDKIAQILDTPKAVENGYTREQIEAAIVSIASYAICITLHAVDVTVSAAISELRADKQLCTFRGYVNELRRVEYELARIMRLNHYIQARERERIEIICREQFEYLPDTLQKMRYGTENFLLCHRLSKNYHLIAASVMAQSMADFAVKTIGLRAEECAQYRTRTAECMRGIEPHRLNDALCHLTDRLLAMSDYENSKVADINECLAIKNGLQIIDQRILDLDLMEMHTAFSLEETKGADWLKANSPQSYYLLHPRECPKPQTATEL